MKLSVNNHEVHIDVDPERTLLSVLRDELHLTGSKIGCSEGQCGACTVLIDGQPTQSCQAAMADLAGKKVTTIEGLAEEGRLHPLQLAFLEADALQCGYCTPGMIMSAAALLDTNPNPSVAEISHFMRDNICRCGVYGRIIAAIRRAAELQEEMADSTGEVGSDQAMAPSAVAPESAGYWDTDALEPVGAGGKGITVAIFDEDVAMMRAELGLSTEWDTGTQPSSGAPDPSSIGPWLHIDEEGVITVHVGKAEVGQNIRTALSQIVAEELRAPLSSIRMIMADTALTPYDRGTFGSRTTPITSPQLRKLGAATRRLLLDLAAQDLAVASHSLAVAEGKISHPNSERSSSYAELAANRQLFTTVSEEETAAPAEQWTTAGQAAAKINGRAFVRGRHRYAYDMQLPGMLFGKVLRPAAFHATLASVDTSAAEAMPGVTVVQDGDFVGVVAADELTATRALDAIRARWRTTLQLSQPELFDYLKENPADPADVDPRALMNDHVVGSVEEGMAAADRRLEQTYTVDYIAHAPLEPRAALAKWDEGRLTVWTGTQRPFGVRSELAQAFQIAEDRVRVIMPDTGSGFGGKHTGEAAIEAARLAKATGKPVKRIWTREEEFTWAYFRPAGLIEVKSGVGDDGTLTAWEFHNYNSGSAGIQTLYDIPNQRVEHHPTDAPPLRQGAYRSLSATANHFARESHMDTLARALEIDPLDFRLQNLQDPRLRAVLTAAAEAFGWGETTPSPRRGFGIAGGYDKGSYVATCAEVAVDRSTGGIQVLRVVQAFECGAIINPDHLRNQVEGAIVHGLGGALYESIQFANGKILNPSFTDYRVPRFEDAPSIEVILLDRKDLPPAGAGETPIVGIAPAIANAIFSATGIRLLSLPMAPSFVEACS